MYISPTINLVHAGRYLLLSFYYYMFHISRIVYFLKIFWYFGLIDHCSWEKPTYYWIFLIFYILPYYAQFIFLVCCWTKFRSKQKYINKTNALAKLNNTEKKKKCTKKHDIDTYQFEKCLPKVTRVANRDQKLRKIYKKFEKKIKKEFFSNLFTNSHQFWCGKCMISKQFLNPEE